MQRLAIPKWIISVISYNIRLQCTWRNGIRMEWVIYLHLIKMRWLKSLTISLVLSLCLQQKRCELPAENAQVELNKAKKWMFLSKKIMLLPWEIHLKPLTIYKHDRIVLYSLIITEIPKISPLWTKKENYSGWNPEKLMVRLQNVIK